MRIPTDLTTNYKDTVDEEFQYFLHFNFIVLVREIRGVMFLITIYEVYMKYISFSHFVKEAIVNDTKSLIIGQHLKMWAYYAVPQSPVCLSLCLCNSF
jgi:hypothetical protein